MLSIFIMLFIAVGIAAGISFAIITMINTAQTSLTIQANQARLQTIANFVRSGLNVDAGRVLLPVKKGVGGAYLARIPDTSPFATTSSGKDIVYCPTVQGKESDALTQSIVNGAESYGIALAEGTDGNEYISKGYPEFKPTPDSPPGAVMAQIERLGIVALLLSPQPNKEGALECRDVTVAGDDYTFLINGGSVTPIFTVATEGRGAVFVIEADGAVHDEFGRKVHALADVKAHVDKYNLTDVAIKIADGAVVKASELADLLDGGFGKTYRIQPVDAASVVSVDPAGMDASSGMLVLNVPGRLYVNDVTLSPGASSFDVVFQAPATGEVFLADTRVGGLISNGGRIATSGATVIEPKHGVDTLSRPVLANGGTITLRSTANPAIYGMSASIVLNALSGTIDVADGLRIIADPDNVSWARNGGRFTSYSQDAAAATVLVNSGDGSYEAVPLQRLHVVTTACEDVGQTECVAQCRPGKVVVSGGCGSGNGLPAIDFGPRDSGSFGCTFPIGVTSPKATVACQ